MRTLSLLTALLVLCAGACRCALKQEFTYALFSNGTVQGYSLGPDGHLTPLPFAPKPIFVPPKVTDGESGMDMTADPEQSVLYVSSYNLTLPHIPDDNWSGMLPDADSTLRAVQIKTDGRLVPLAPAVLPVNTPAYTLTLAAKHHLLYVQAAAGIILVHRMAHGGRLLPLPAVRVFDTSSRPLGPGGFNDSFGVASLTIDPNERFATLSYDGGTKERDFARVVRYRIGAHGKLVPFQTLWFTDCKLASVNVTPDGKTLYLTAGRFIAADGTNMSGTRQYRVRRNGTLAAMSPLTVGQDEGPAFLNTPGRLLYSASDWPANNGFSIYRVGKDGRLTFAAHENVPNSSVELLGGDLSGHFVYVIVTPDSHVARLVGYRVSTNGTLGPPFTLPVRGVPESLVFVQR